MNSNLKKIRIISFLLMGCLGITTEIFFTAIYDIVMNKSENPMILKGYSYIWMFPIYGLSALTFPVIAKKLSPLPQMIRSLIVGIGILVVEYISGYFLRKLTGFCPWEYKEGMHIHGLIRLDFYPFWVAFAFILEKLLVKLEIKLIKCISTEVSEAN
jgi:uncharacterized membrane protein